MTKPFSNSGIEQLSIDAAWMELALAEASKAADAGEVPVGALVIKDGEIVGRAGNRNLRDHDPSAHAEIVAMREAAQRVVNHRLTGCVLYATIEPCAMCAGAIIHARISRLVYGAKDVKAGAAGSVLDVINHPRLNHKLEVVSGLLEDRCSGILQEFFQRKREKREPDTKTSSPLFLPQRTTRTPGIRLGSEILSGELPVAAF